MDLRSFAKALSQTSALPDDPALGWAALDAAGLGGGFREAVRTAGGPLAVLSRGAVAAFAHPRRRHRVLDHAAIAARLHTLLPFVGDGGHIVADDASLARLSAHPALALYTTRALPDPSRPHVAIVGSRQASPDMLERAYRFAGSLANDGAVIVSGGATGIDTVAAEGALQAGGDVIVVSGRAALRIDSAWCAPRLCWTTPYGPWAPGMPGGRFAQRNWYIAAFADVTIAVCGGPRSGTRHTVMAALTFRRPVGVFAPEQGEQGALSRRVLDGDCGVVIDEHTTLQTLLSLPAIDGARARFDKHILGPLAGQPSLPLVPLASPSPLIRLLQTRGALTIDEAATALQQSVRELMVDVATLELDGALRKEGALLSLSQ